MGRASLQVSHSVVASTSGLPEGLPFDTQVLLQALVASASTPHLLAFLFSLLVGSG